MFSITDKESAMAPEDYGLINGHCTLNGWIEDVAEIRGFIAPPFFSPDFDLVLRFNDLRVAAAHHHWHPAMLTRRGSRAGMRIASDLVLVKDSRTMLMRTTVKNATRKTLALNIQYELSGSCGQSTHWRFGKSYQKTAARTEKRWGRGVLTLFNEQGALAVASSLKVAPNLPVCSGVLNAPACELAPGASVTFYTAAALGEPRDCRAAVRYALEDPEARINDALKEWDARQKRLFDRLPDLQSDCRELVDYYHTSLLHLLLNEWQVPEYRLHPHYGTGSMMGDTVCCYMWNYGGPYQLWSLLSPRSAREHLLTMLALDLRNCYAFFADDGTALGPYYPINHEKVIFLACAYVTQTRDVAFLNETVDGKSVIARLVDEALAHDDLNFPAVLADYGTANDHLELRGAHYADDPLMRYCGILPDLNLRRCVSMHLVDRLCRLAKYQPRADLAARAGALKKLIHEKLYSPERGWFKAIDPEGREVWRWTIQMFKALGWGDWALYPEAEAALLRHLLDEREFLGRFGLHSLSKLDPAYDEADIDNGGPGACVSFPAAIMLRLYRSGRAREAETILRRLLWMGRRLPYWGDSQRADALDYRRCTSLKCNIEGACPAQTLIFGMFGVDVREDFSVAVTPHVPEFSRFIRLKNLRIAGKVLDIYADRDRVEVRCDGKLRRGKPGETLIFG